MCKTVKLFLSLFAFFIILALVGPAGHAVICKNQIKTVCSRFKNSMNRNHSMLRYHHKDVSFDNVCDDSNDNLCDDSNDDNNTDLYGSADPKISHLYIKTARSTKNLSIEVNCYISYTGMWSILKC